MRSGAASTPLWVRVGLPLVILAVALVVGSGALSPHAQTPAQRAAAIEAVVRCPSCIDVSVAQSEESTALAVRHQIERQVAQGLSTSRIEQALVDQYGQTILLESLLSGSCPSPWAPAPWAPSVCSFGVAPVSSPRPAPRR